MGAASKASKSKGGKGAVIGGALGGPTGAAVGYAAGRQNKGSFAKNFDPVEGQRKEAEKRSKQAQKDYAKQQKDLEKYVKKNYPQYRSLNEAIKSGQVQPPTAKGYESERIAPQLQGDLRQTQQDIGYLRGIGQGQGVSALGQRQLEAQQLDEQTGQENLAKQRNVYANQQFNQLASQGGADRASRARLQSQVGTQNLFAQQALARQGQQQRAGIMSEDEARKLNIAQNLSNQNLALAQERRAGLSTDQAAANQASQFNAGQENQFSQNLFGAQLGDLQSQRAAEQDQFQTLAGLKAGGLVGQYQLGAASQTPGLLGYGSGYAGSPNTPNLFNFAKI